MNKEDREKLRELVEGGVRGQKYGDWNDSIHYTIYNGYVRQGDDWVPGKFKVEFRGRVMVENPDYRPWMNNSRQNEYLYKITRTIYYPVTDMDLFYRKAEAAFDRCNDFINKIKAGQVLKAMAEL